MRRKDVSVDRGWGFVAGIVSSLCCLGPAAAALFGLSASSALALFQVDRTAALALSLGLLAVGVTLGLRRTSRCGLHPVQRLRGPLALLLAFAISYGVFTELIPRLAAGQIAAAEAATAVHANQAGSTDQLLRLNLSIVKMDCPPCAAHVHARLMKQPGVVRFLAEPNVDQVIIDYQPTLISATALVQLFPPSYGVTVLSEAAAPAAAHDQFTQR